MTALLSIQNLQTHFHTDDGIVKAVDGVSFEVRPGETIGIVGESGSGKSVTSLSIMRLIAKPAGRFKSGEILFQGKDILKLSESELREIRGNRISMIFQDPMTSLNPYMTIGRQLTEVLEIHKNLKGTSARKKVLTMLKRVGISEPERRFPQYPHEFSGGMRQRVMIAMALLCEPKLLIADEPTTALDVTIQAQILSLIDEMKKEIEMSVILITHDLGVVAGMADRILVMYAGKIVESGKVDHVFDNPKHPYTHALLKSLPRLNEQRSDKLESIRGMPPDLSKNIEGCPFAPRCDFVQEKCKEKYPDLFTFEKEHYSACWETKKL